MKKQELIDTFINNHQEIISYIDQLDNQKFVYSRNDKWTAGQQLKHILLTIIPLSKILSSKEFILDKFGTIDRPILSSETTLKNYLNTSLQAPEQFLPEKEIKPDQKADIISDIQEHLENIKNLLGNFSEEELDRLALPHPLLGKLSIREMFYVMGYHPLHHLKQVILILENDK